MSDSGSHSGNTGMFGIFVLTIVTIVLVPYTLYKLCNVSEETAATWAESKGKKKKSSIGASLKRLATKDNLILLALWVGWLLLLMWVSAAVGSDQPFDPFEILEVSTSATDREIKKAYRSLSLKFHPDKNPDPKATEYFASYITKAYQALTDEKSRANWEKYGHPDGQQSVNLGIALPTWIFPKDRESAPYILIALIGGGILLPLTIVACYMLRSNKYTGPNNIMQETLQFYVMSKYSIKESQSLVRIPETLVCAMEFIQLNTPPDHRQPLEELGMLVKRSNPDLKDKPLFWRRIPSVLKANLLLLAHMDREPDIPAKLQPDLKFVLQKTPLLLEEMLKIAAALPRAPYGYGWLAPSVAVVEMMQCFYQCVPIGVRKPATGKASDMATVALTQLPHFDADVIKKLKRRNVRSVADLTDMGEADRTEAMVSAGLTTEQAEAASLVALSLPTLHMRASIEGVDGEDEIIEGDPVRVTLHFALTRPSHSDAAYEMPPGGKAVKAVTPLMAAIGPPRDEVWYFLVVDPASNSVLCYTKQNMAEAESWALEHKAEVSEFEKDKPQLLLQAAGVSGGGESKKKGFTKKDARGQELVMGIMAPSRANKYELQVIAMPESYIGCDRSVPLKLKVAPRTRAVEEGRDARSKEKLKKWADDDDNDEDADVKKKIEARDETTDEEDDEEDDEESDIDYDSDETGELETDDEEEAQRGAKAAVALAKKGGGGGGASSKDASAAATGPAGGDEDGDADGEEEDDDDDMPSLVDAAGQVLGAAGAKKTQ